MGMSKVRFKAEVDFDGRVVTRSYLEKQDIEQLLQVCLNKMILLLPAFDFALQLQVYLKIFQVDETLK